MHDLSKIRKDFPILSKEIAGKKLIYLDNAATTHKPRPVLDAIYDYYTNLNSNVGRGVYTLSMQSGEAYENARATLQRFINAPHAHEVIFTKGTTDGVNLVAGTLGRKLLGKGDEILITGMEHHSNILPWKTVCSEKGARIRVTPFDEGGIVAMDAFRELLGERTRMVAITHISNVFGTINPIKEMIAEAHQRGIPVLVDGAQSVAHLKIDVQDLDADFFCFSGHKMYGPMGIGVLYGKEKFLEQMDVYQSGGGVAMGVSYEDKDIYKGLPHKFEAGTPSIADAIGLAAAAKYLSELGHEWVFEHEHELIRYATERMQEIPGLKVIGTAKQKGGLVSFIMEGYHPYDIGNHANAHGIAVRTGVHCAIPVLDSLELVGTVRASVGVYNTREEIDALVQVLRTVPKGDWTLKHANTRFL
jgi:cysteine desulfurase/selenocysteine lyase